MPSTITLNYVEHFKDSHVNKKLTLGVSTKSSPNITLIVQKHEISKQVVVYNGTCMPFVPLEG